MTALRILAIAIVLVTAGCGSANNPEGDLTVVATTTILGDVARNVVGDSASVEVLLPLGTDPHDYQASSQQIALIQEADLVIANGLHLEEGLLGVLETAAADGANVLSLGEMLDPLPFGSESADDEDHNDDPHFWLDPQRMAEATALIARELEAIDDTVDWQGRSDAYAAQLLATDEVSVEILSAIPTADRKLVTNHDSLGYFAARYDFDIIGTVIPGGSTIADPSSSELADLVRLVASENVPAIFASTSEPAALADAVAAEVGTDVEIVDLYTGSLGEPGSGADTLLGLLETNARLIAEAMT
ncbi:MAG: zinc ABC transporter substrate-binding protein [bacterium]|nr:zinc ABC transporter substrate-binding protein [bacterium]MCP4965754.1 zinc ABC transporter substrate-binding protein [bacterium]